MGRGTVACSVASAYSALKTKYEWRETKAGVTSAGRWIGAWRRVRCEHVHCTEDRVRVARNEWRSHFSGAMVERKVQKASTHSSVLSLRAYKGAMHRNVSQSKHPSGRWDRAWWRVRWRLAERTPVVAVFEWIWHDCKVTVPLPMETPPPPCQSKQARQ